MEKIKQLLSSLRSKPRLLGLVIFIAVFAGFGLYLLLSSSALSQPTFLTPVANASTRGVIGVKVDVNGANRGTKGKLLVDGVDTGGFFAYDKSARAWTFRAADGSVGLNTAAYTTGTHQLVAVFGSVQSAPLVINNTAYVKILQPAQGSTNGHTVTFSGTFTLSTPPSSLKLYLDGQALPGTVVGSTYGYVYKAPDGSMGVTIPATGTHTLVFQADALKSAPVSFTVADLGVTKIMSPVNGATVTSPVSFTAQIDNPTSPYLLIDGVQATGKLVPTSTGWLYQNTNGEYNIPLAAGTHTLQIVNGTQKSTIVTITVSSTSISGSGGPSGGTWGDHMGISMWMSTTNIDKAKALGVKWVRMSWEQNWGTFDYTLINYAHSQGIKVLQACQKSSHTYYSSDISTFASYCAAWVDHGIDALEIGNEWNHLPFWNPDPSGNYVLQAQLTDATSAAIRAKSSTIPIMNAGWSPESSPDLPQQAMGLTLDSSNGNYKATGSAIAHHGYAYNCDSPLLCAYPTRKDWNAFLATQDVYSVAKGKGYDKPVWLTELGGPSGNGNNLYTGQPFTLSSQQQLYKDYITGIKQMRTNGTPITMIFWHTIQDGQSSTNTVEKTFGLYDVNWAIKPAGQTVQSQASQAW